MGRRTRSYSVRVVPLFGLLRTFRYLLDRSRDRDQTTNSDFSRRQSDKTGDFLCSLSRSHSSFVPLGCGCDGDAYSRCGFMAYPTKEGYGYDAYLNTLRTRGIAISSLAHRQNSETSHLKRFW